MVSLTDLPIELLPLILSRAVEVRGLKRALRLKLVCKLFCKLVPPAIYDSASLLLEFQDRSPRHAPEFYQCFLAHHALKPGAPAGSIPRMIHETARALIERRCARGPSNTYQGEEVKQIVKRLSLIPILTHYFEINPSSYFKPIDHYSETDSGTGASIDYLLLSATAYLDDHELMDDLMQKGLHSPNIFGPFSSPHITAAHAGHLEMLKRLIRDVMAGHPSVYLRDQILTAALQEGHQAIIDLALDPSWETGTVTTRARDFEKMTLRALEGARSKSDFCRYFEDVRESIQDYELKWLPDQLEHAAKIGATDLVDHLLTLGAPANGRLHKPLRLAVRAGHEGVVERLLREEPPDDQSLVLAVRSGSTRMVNTLLKNGKFHGNQAHAYAEALARENLNMVQTLRQAEVEMSRDIEVLIQQIETEGYSEPVLAVCESKTLSLSSGRLAAA